MSGARSGVPSSGIHPSASHTHADQWLTRIRIEKKRAVSATYELTEYRTCGMVERVARWERRPQGGGGRGDGGARRTLSRSHHLP